MHPAPITRPHSTHPDDLNHYLTKADILRSMVEGIEVTALCGETLRPSTQGGGSVHGRDIPICPLCALIIEEMPA